MALGTSIDKSSAGESRMGLKSLLKIARFYPAEYAFTLITSLIVLASLSGLGAMLIDQWINGASETLASSGVIFLLATLIVALPIHFVFYWRVRHTDKSELTQFSLRVANASLAVYLFVTVGTIVTLTILLLVAWLNALIGTGDFDKTLATVTLAALQAIGWLKYATWHFLRARTDQSRPKYYVLAVGILSLAILVLGFVFPARAYHDTAQDFVKENDLTQIEHAINDYADAQGTLPSDLPALHGLEDTISNQLSDYRYTPKDGAALGVFSYELCATFAQSAGSNATGGFGYFSHGTGEQCFERVTISGSQFEQSLQSYFTEVESGTAKLEQGIARFLQGVEGKAKGQISQLEGYLEGVEGGSAALQKEMQRLEQDIVSSAGISGDLDQEFAEAEKFISDLICALDPQCNPSQD